MEEESITDANSISVDTFSHAYSAQRENANAIFTSEKLDKSDELVDAVNNLTINDAKYYESSTATTSDAQGNLTINPETVTHTSNISFEQKLLSYRTIPILPPPTNLRFVSIKLMPQTLLTPGTKKIVTDVALGGA